MDHQSVAVTESIEAPGEFRSLSIGRGARDLVSIDPLALCLFQRLLLALAALLGGGSSPVTPGRHCWHVEYLSKL